MEVVPITAFFLRRARAILKTRTVHTLSRYLCRLFSCWNLKGLDGQRNRLKILTNHEEEVSERRTVDRVS